jgi:serine/threonine-protein kinase
VIKTTGALPGRRIFVDKRTVGQTPAAITVSCGVHTVQLGSAGTARQIDVPCGGELDVGAR